MIKRVTIIVGIIMTTEKIEFRLGTISTGDGRGKGKGREEESDCLLLFSQTQTVELEFEIWSIHRQRTRCLAHKEDVITGWGRKVKDQPLIEN